MGTPFSAFDIPTKTIAEATENSAPNQVLFQNDTEGLASSPLMIFHETIGSLATVYGGLQGSGFLVMAPGSVKADIADGYVSPTVSKYLGGMLYDGVGGRGFGFFGGSGEPTLWASPSTTSYAHGGQTWAEDAWIFGPSSPSVGFRLVVQGLTDDSTTYAFGCVNYGRSATLFTVRDDGQVGFDATNTAAGTTGDRTIHKPSGKVNFAASATTLTVNNNLCQTTSIVLATVLSNDSTAQIKNVVPGTNNFIIHLAAAATAETSVGFLVIN